MTTMPELPTEAYDLSHYYLAHDIDKECGERKVRGEWPANRREPVTITLRVNDLDCLPLTVQCDHGLWRLAGFVACLSGAKRATYERM